MLPAVHLPFNFLLSIVPEVGEFSLPLFPSLLYLAACCRCAARDKQTAESNGAVI